MKKTILFWAAAAMVFAANATILRVSNVPGCSAPYTSIQDAHNAASEGDTIMVDGSSIEYASVEIKKRIVLIGPGYWLSDNGIVDESAPHAQVHHVTITSDASGTVLQGLRIYDNLNNAITIQANNCVVNRCFIAAGSGNGMGIMFQGKDYTISGAVIHQNYFNNCSVDGARAKPGSLETMMANVQVTNNIFVVSGWAKRCIESLNNSYIAYNTIITDDTNDVRVGGCHTCTIEQNIIPNQSMYYNNIHIVDDNEWGDNYVGDVLDSKGEKVYSTSKTDKDICDAEMTMSEGKYGASAGDSPYVVSGIPAGPVIQDLIIPTSVEKGSTMNVTIKVGIQK